MKKTIIIIIVVLFFLSCIFGIIKYIRKSNEIGDIVLKYGVKERFLNEEKSSHNFVLNEKKAIYLAEKVWKEKYGDTKEIYKKEILEKKPYVAEYDWEYHVWHIYGTASMKEFAGEPHVLIRQYDGKALAIWLTK